MLDILCEWVLPKKQTMQNVNDDANNHRVALKVNNKLCVNFAGEGVSLNQNIKQNPSVVCNSADD